LGDTAEKLLETARKHPVLVPLEELERLWAGRDAAELDHYRQARGEYERGGGTTKQRRARAFEQLGWNARQSKYPDPASLLIEYGCLRRCRLADERATQVLARFYGASSDEAMRGQLRRAYEAVRLMLHSRPQWCDPDEHPRFLEEVLEAAGGIPHF
jgi:hypothetical protein